MDIMSDDGDRKSLRHYIMHATAERCSINTFRHETPVPADERLRKQKLRPTLELLLQPGAVWNDAKMSTTTDVLPLVDHTLMQRQGVHIHLWWQVYIDHLFAPQQKFHITLWLLLYLGTGKQLRSNDFELVLSCSGLFKSTFMRSYIYNIFINKKLK